VGERRYLASCYTLATACSSSMNVIGQVYRLPAALYSGKPSNALL